MDEGPSFDPFIGLSCEMDAAIQRILQHLPIRGNVVLTLLKGHLLVEETIRRCVDRKLARSRPIEEAQLTFHQACCLTRALYPAEGMGWVWEAIKKLNRLRNDLAHNLEPVGFQKRVEEFQDFVTQSTLLPDPIEIQQEMGRLALTFAKLIAFIHVGLSPLPDHFASTLSHVDSDEDQSIETSQDSCLA